ncbi:hypothetical protein [Actinomadura parmotrematis]|uniref:Galactose mutarotase n=1 Tax=Actinomadura parmotrematis TaxID=2864039 RepID=A0ABS7G3D2_9ACTN|nr:hypothetical protein [Actinomadura parmotrematis]MBW8486735.1 hypothetical protein [Actinomadura parmotrematis]
MNRTTLHGAVFKAAVSADGAALTSVRDRATGTELLLRTPWADQTSGALRFTGSGAEWHRRYPGGWHPLIPHAGDARVLDGVEHPFHGEAAWREWDLDAAASDRCALTTVLRTVPLALRREIALTGDGLTVTQTVRNLSAAPARFAWTEHPAFGPDLIGDGCVLELDGDGGTRRFPLRPDARRPDALTVLNEGVRAARLVNERLGFGVELGFDPGVFDHVWIWRERRATPGFPWWGLVDTVAVEPASGPYTPEPGRLGRHLLDAGEERTGVLTLKRVTR